MYGLARIRHFQARGPSADFNLVIRERNPIFSSSRTKQDTGLMLVVVNSRALETLQSDPVLCTVRFELPCMV
jgi:hypothetical protein